MSMPAKTSRDLVSARSTHTWSSPPPWFTVVLWFARNPTQLPPRLLPPARGSRSCPVPLSAERGVTAHIPRRSPTDCGAIPPAFAPPPPLRVSWHFSRLARSVVACSALNLYPVQTDPR